MALKRIKHFWRRFIQIWESCIKNWWRDQSCQILVMECFWKRLNIIRAWGNWRRQRRRRCSSRINTIKMQELELKMASKPKSQGSPLLMNTSIWFQTSHSTAMRALKRKFYLKITAITNAQVPFQPSEWNSMEARNTKQELKVPLNLGKEPIPIIEKGW